MGLTKDEIAEAFGTDAATLQLAINTITGKGNPSETHPARAPDGGPITSPLFRMNVQRLPTVEVVSIDGSDEPFVINREDFDARVHREVNPPVPAPVVHEEPAAYEPAKTSEPGMFIEDDGE